MKSLIIIILSASMCFSQGIVNNGAKISLFTGTNIYIKDAGFTNVNDGEIDNDGSIYLEKNWVNNGTTNVFINTNSTGDVSFTGSVNQEIGGSNKTIFENIDINNGHYVYLAENTDVLYNLKLTSGIFDLKDKIASLGSTGVIVNETEINRVTATDVSGITVNNTGTITATYTLNNTTNYDPANLGVKITTNQALGNVTVTRGHKIQTGNYNGSASEGVARYYIVPGIGKLNGTTINVNMEYWDAELNSLTEANLEGYNWVTEGSSSSWWTPLDGSINTSTNLFTTSANPYDDYFNTSTWYGFTWSDKFTLGSTGSPLPIVLTDISASCINNNAEIKWSTSSEINNNYFTIEKSDNGLDFTKIKEIKAAGNSNSLINYNFIDETNNAQTYYRLSQTDFDGTTETFKVITANCKNSNTDNSIIIYPNPAKNYVNIKLPSKNDLTNLFIYNDLSQIIYTQKLQNIESDIRINTSDFKNGVYIIVIESNYTVIKKQLIINK